jgi:hypothetical protein
MRGHGQKLTAKQEALIAALLTEPTHAAAADKAGVSEATLYRWLQLPEFRAAYHAARRQLVEAAVGRMQAATGEVVDTLLAVVREGEKDSDRVRAGLALLDRALRGLTDADALHGEAEAEGAAAIRGTADVVQLLARRLGHVDQAELPTAEKARLTAALADALLRAIGVDVIDKRLEALQAVLMGRKEKGKR